jgi:hypothetical protein
MTPDMIAFDCLRRLYLHVNYSKGSVGLGGIER